MTTIPPLFYPTLEIARSLLARAREEKKAADWKLAHEHTHRWNVYYTKGAELEDVLQSERHDLTATAYVKQGKSGKRLMGESSFPILSNNENAIRQQIQDALFACTLTDKEDFDIPDDSFANAPAIELADPEIIAAASDGKGENGVHTLLAELGERFSGEFKKYGGVKLNGMEIHASITERRVLNSKGVDVHQKATEIYIETVITAVDGKRESEFFPAMTVSRLSDVDVTAFVKKYVTFAKDVLSSSPPCLFTGAVVLSEDAIPDFFAPRIDDAPLTAHTFGSTHYMGLARYEKGKQVIPGKVQGDKITLVNDPLVPLNPASQRFDRDGIAARRQVLIDKGIFVGFVASKRFADYLKIQPSGPLGVIELGAGSKTVKELYQQPCIEIVSFSSFVPNSLSGDFAAEIRLGYLHKDGQKLPFKGGMVSGNVFEAFANVYFSEETITIPDYSGPKAVRFEKLTVSGRE
ncbi:hypothetical protein HYU19_04930 [Candidatus Woesearchaeota archaeon]|nr:hypothetical protein [Candidatus Woesearchaeota archaeon]